MRLEIAVHEHLGLRLDRNSEERIEVRDGNRNFLDALVVNQVVLGKVIRLPLEGGKIEPVQPDVGVVAEQGLGCVLPADKRFDHFGIKDADASGLVARIDVIVKATLAQVFLENLAGRSIDTIDTGNRQLVIQEHLGILDKAIEIVVHLGRNLHHARPFGILDTVITAARTSTGNGFNFKAVGIAMSKKVFVYFGR